MLSDSDFIHAVARQVAEGGWSSFVNIAKDEEEAISMVEGGWSTIYDVVSSQDIDSLREDYSHIDED